MFSALTEKFQNLFSSLSGNKKLSEDNIASVVREVRLALLDADVNYSVASDFVRKVKEKALGDAVMKSIKPREQFIKIVHEELVDLMGGEEKELDLVKRPALIMLCGLQGSGKTTHVAKLGYYLQKKDKKVLLAACDTQRPAAIEQLHILGKENNLAVFSLQEQEPITIAKKAYERALQEKYDVLIVDTAGRLHIDEDLMQELKQMRKALPFSEVLFVANATTGQDAVKTATKFDEMVSITGSILTMLDGDARAGAALSIKKVTQKPLLFEGVGEKIGDMQLFTPSSMADRILGMGDVINLVRKAEQHISKSQEEEMKKKIRKADFTFEDYLQQMQMLKKMGSMKSLLKMMPGASSMLGDLAMPEKEMLKMQAIILSMTPQERRLEVEMMHSRKMRIAKGSATSVDLVNKLLKGFKRIKQLMKKMPKKGFMANMKQMIGGNNLWH